MSYGDFCRLTLEEFEAIYKAWGERQEAIEHGAWERMRLQASIAIQPHVKNRITPQQLLPLPWDHGKQAQREPGPKLTKEERRARVAQLFGVSTDNTKTND